MGIYEFHLIKRLSNGRICIIEQNAAGSANGDIGRSIFAANSVGWLQINTTLHIRSSCDSDETVFTPERVPRISDDPIVAILRISSITDELNGVVNVRIGLVASVEDTGLVVAPGGGVDAYGDGADGGDRFEEGCINIGRENRVVDDFGLKRGIRGRKFALLVAALVRGVRIGPFGSDATSLDDLLESDLSGAASTAASATALVRVRRAIQNLLFGEVLEITVCECPV